MSEGTTRDFTGLGVDKSKPHFEELKQLNARSCSFDSCWFDAPSITDYELDIISTLTTLTTLISLTLTIGVESAHSYGVIAFRGSCY